MGPDEANPVLRAMDKLTEEMADVGIAHLDQLIRRGMKPRFARAAVLQSTIAALVALEILRLKEEVPVTDVSKLVDDVDHIRAKVRRALVDGVLEAAKKYDPDLMLGRAVGWEEYLGEDLSQ